MNYSIRVDHSNSTIERIGNVNDSGVVDEYAMGKVQAGFNRGTTISAEALDSVTGNRRNDTRCKDNLSDTVVLSVRDIEIAQFVDRNCRGVGKSGQQSRSSVSSEPDITRSSDRTNDAV